MIDWKDGSSKVSKYFTVKECLWLPQWNRLANDTDGLTSQIKANLVNLCQKMDVVREFFGQSINVHVTYRPEAYNTLVKGAKASSHVQGMAMDFHVSGIDCDDARAKLEGQLNALDMRMEKLPGGNWVHLDTRTPGPSGRYFPV